MLDLELDLGAERGRDRSARCCWRSLDFDIVARLSESVEFHPSVSQESVPILILAFGEEILDEAIVQPGGSAQVCTGRQNQAT